MRKTVSWKKLYAQEPYTDFTRLERWESPDEMGQINFPQGAELLVLEGAFTDAEGDHPRLSWLRVPRGGSINPTSAEPCELYIKEGGFNYMR